MLNYKGDIGQSLTLSESSQVFLLIWIVCHSMIDALPFIMLRNDLLQKNKVSVIIIATSSIIQKFFQSVSILAFGPVTSWLAIISAVTGLLILTMGNILFGEIYTEKTHPFIAKQFGKVRVITFLLWIVLNLLIFVRVGWIGVPGPSFIYHNEGAGIIIFLGYFFISSMLIYTFVCQHLFKLIVKFNSIRKRTLVNRESIKRLFLAVLGILIFQITLVSITLYLVGFTIISPPILALLTNTTSWNANLLILAMFLFEKLAVPVSPPSAIDLINMAKNPSVIEPSNPNDLDSANSE